MSFSSIQKKYLLRSRYSWKPHTHSPYYFQSIYSTHWRVQISLHHGGRYARNGVSILLTYSWKIFSYLDSVYSVHEEDWIKKLPSKEVRSLPRLSLPYHEGIMSRRRISNSWWSILWQFRWLYSTAEGSVSLRMNKVKKPIVKRKISAQLSCRYIWDASNSHTTPQKTDSLPFSDSKYNKMVLFRISCKREGDLTDDLDVCI